MSHIRSDDHEEGVRVLTFTSPPANAINEGLLAALEAELDRAEADRSVRAVVLAGSGGFYCAGFDFAAPQRGGAEAANLARLYHRAHLKLLTLPKPTIAMMNGHAIAGGLVLVLACDYRLGLEGDYKVGFTEVMVGASFPKVAMEIVQLRLPHARACELILGAATYPASQALRLGIVDELIAPEKFDATVLRRAARLAGMPRDAFVHAKAALLAPAVTRIGAETPDEVRQGLAVWTSPESRQARRRLREKLGIPHSEAGD